MNHLMEEVEEVPGDIEQTAGLLTKTATLEESGAAKAMSVRMPLHVYATVKAMADHSGLSVNRIAVQLLRSGIEAVGAQLRDQDAQSIGEIRDKVLWEAVQEHDGEQLER